MIADRIQLWKMERILEKEWNVKLSKEQRAVILSPARKNLSMGLWGRGTGKTLTACLWYLIQERKDLCVNVEACKRGQYDQRGRLIPHWKEMRLPDPDNAVGRMAYRVNLEALHRIYWLFVGKGVRFDFVICLFKNSERSLSHGEKEQRAGDI